MTTDETPLRVEQHGPHLVATIDDPVTRNALSDALGRQLHALLDRLADDRSVRSLVLRGANGVFCAGANLKGSVGARESQRDQVRALSVSMGDLLLKLVRCPLPVVAVVEGPAFGGGFGLACCADIVIAGPTARFALSETRLGLVPAQIAPFVLSRVGLNGALKLALSGERLDGPGAKAVGLADIATDDPDQALDALLDNIDRCGPEANAATKRLFLDLATQGLETFREKAADIFLAALEGAEGREGIAAFTEKRAPAWSRGG